jgi:hypothetical protein
MIHQLEEVIIASLQDLERCALELVEAKAHDREDTLSYLWKDGQRAIIIKDSVQAGDQVLFRFDRDKYVALQCA